MSVSTYVVAGEVVDRGLGQHGVVLELRLAERGSVAGDDDKLGLAGAEGLQAGSPVSASRNVYLSLKKLLACPSDALAVEIVRLKS